MSSGAEQGISRGSTDPEHAANLRRATFASSVGSALEYYAFALYGLASALAATPHNARSVEELR